MRKKKKLIKMGERYEQIVHERRWPWMAIKCMIQPRLNLGGTLCGLHNNWAGNWGHRQGERATLLLPTISSHTFLHFLFFFCSFHPFVWRRRNFGGLKSSGLYLSYGHTATSAAAAAAAKSRQSCPTLCDPIDGSPPGSSVPGILQARILEWVAISFS